MKDSEISKLVKFASEYGLDLAVRGGGHSTGGTSSTAGGLVIDLSRMRQVIVDANAKVITAQGGALWEDVDYAAAAHGLAAVGGTVNHTGIGGLTLGGGLGWLTGQYGAVIDNLLAARVVIADGSILNTSKTENPDLFWAIRGAGHNFGVTVEFTFRAHEQPNEVYAGGIVFTSDKLPSIVDALNERLEHPDPKGAAMCVFAKPPQLPAAVVVVNLFYNGTEEQGKKYFASLFDLGPIVCEAKMMPYSGVNGMLNAMALPGGRRALKGTSFALPVSKDFMRELWDYYVNELEANPDMSETFIGAEFYDLTKVSSVPLDAASFANRGQYISGIVGISWTDPTKDEHNRAWGRGVLTKCRDWILKTHREPKSGQVIEYANYIERKIISSS